MSSSTRKICLAIFLGLIGVVNNPATATPITVADPFAYLMNTANNSSGTPTGIRELFGAANVVPNGANGTTGTASRGLNTVTQFFAPFDVAPNYFRTSIPFIPGTTGTGPWTLNFQNGTDTAQAVTPSITGATVVPFANAVAISGSGSAPTFNWNVPSTFSPDGVRILIRDTSNFVGGGGVGGNGVANIIYSKTFAGSSTSFTVNANDPSLTQSLQQGKTYSIEINLLDTRNNLATTNFETNILSESRAFFDFTLLPAGSPPNVFLPTLVTGASPYYQFNVSNIVAGQQVFIDPVVATGYTYMIGAGDPNFASALLPTGIGDNLFDLFLWSGSDYLDSGIDLTGGVLYSFAPGGVDRFQIRGIETSAGLDPTNTTAFITGLTFTGDGQFTGTMTPLTQNVPEPATLTLLFLGLVGVGVMRRRYRRS